VYNSYTAIDSSHIEGLFKKRVLRKIFGSKRDEVRGDWRRLHNEELHDSYFSSNVIKVNNSRKMRYFVCSLLNKMKKKYTNQRVTLS